MSCPAGLAAACGPSPGGETHRREIELACAQGRENFGEPRLAVGHLERRRAHIAQHRVIPRQIRLIERQHSVANHKNDMDIVWHGGGRLRLRRGKLRRGRRGKSLPGCRIGRELSLCAARDPGKRCYRTHNAQGDLSDHGFSDLGSF
jgi:hypothetical protein